MNRDSADHNASDMKRSIMREKFDWTKRIILFVLQKLIVKKLDVLLLMTIFLFILFVSTGRFQRNLLKTHRQKFSLYW